MKNPWNYKNNGDECDETRIISIEKSSNDAAAIGNKLYFYSDVSKDTMLSLIKQIDEMSKQLKIVQYTFNLPTPPPIELHICSDGGDVFSSIAAVDRIMNSQIPIHTYCEGIVASAATLISCSGHKRFITKSSCMLIHQVSGGLWGNYAEFKEEIKNLELIMSLIKGIYVKKTQLDSTKLDEILGHDLYMNAEECLVAGLVDEIV
jgi:ATP-dependent protease ClpP protease subunit